LVDFDSLNIETARKIKEFFQQTYQDVINELIGIEKTKLSALLRCSFETIAINDMNVGDCSLAALSPVCV
jgi:hypothetical protein